MEKLLTIVIPSYNISKYIDKITQSLVIAKNSKKIEILIVNDGSTDNTLELAKKYEMDYPEIIRVIDKKNGGHGSTINTGINFASGKYFKVIDGDDWVDTNEIDNFLEKISDIDDDMIVCSYTQVTDEGEVLDKISSIPNGYKYDISYNISDVCRDTEDAYEFHRVYYKTEVYKKSKLIDENCFYVDLEYILYPLKYVKTVRFLNYNIYMYRLGRNGQSVSLDSYMKNRNNLGTVLSSLCSFVSVEKLDNNVSDYIIRRIDSFVSTIITIYYLNKNKKDAEEFYNNTISGAMINFPEIFLKLNSKKYRIFRLFNNKLFVLKKYILKLMGKLKL